MLPMIDAEEGFLLIQGSRAGFLISRAVRGAVGTYAGLIDCRFDNHNFSFSGCGVQ